MSDVAERFLENWLQANIADRPLHPSVTLAGLVRRCRRAARIDGVPIEELKAVAGDLGQTILDEFIVNGKPPPKR
jgi:hypothetical protein